ncbi:hypothetical protein DFH09DRAFT_1145287 [Mycena vulgaris]|nr:hypothetical protein DFH09DRAFT_1145287 [Mycena vulgaris]
MADGLETRTTLPQELVDLILDHVHLDPDGREESLRACALTARSFVRPSQIHLFSRVDSSRALREFSGLILSSPHVAAYVQTLNIRTGPGSPGHTSHILCSLPHLRHIDLSPDARPHRRPSWCKQPAPVRASLLVACVLPSVRCITFRHYTFRGGFELQILLRNSPGLTELRLERVRFDAPLLPSSPRRLPSPKARAVLNSLTVSAIEGPKASELLNVFSSIDIKHLRKVTVGLILKGFALVYLLRANARSLEEVDLYDIDFRGRNHRAAAEADILAGENRLRLVTLCVKDAAGAASVLRLVGSLAHLKALKTVRIVMAAKVEHMDVGGWTLLDSLFTSAGNVLDGLEVHMHFVFVPTAEEQGDVRARMPSLDAGALHIHDDPWRDPLVPML